VRAGRCSAMGDSGACDVIGRADDASASGDPRDLRQWDTVSRSDVGRIDGPTSGVWVHICVLFCSPLERAT
jgi:hypothetical protein